MSIGQALAAALEEFLRARETRRDCYALAAGSCEQEYLAIDDELEDAKTKLAEVIDRAIGAIRG